MSTPAIDAARKATRDAREVLSRFYDDHYDDLDEQEPAIMQLICDADDKLFAARTLLNLAKETR